MAADDKSNKSNEDTEKDKQFLVKLCKSKNNNKSDSLAKNANVNRLQLKHQTIKQDQYMNVDSGSSTTGDSDDSNSDFGNYSQRNSYRLSESPEENVFFLESLNQHFIHEKSITNANVNFFDAFNSTAV